MSNFYSTQEEISEKVQKSLIRQIMKRLHQYEMHWIRRIYEIIFLNLCNQEGVESFFRALKNLT
jgi:hypothetical protein